MNTLRRIIHHTSPIGIFLAGAFALCVALPTQAMLIIDEDAAASADESAIEESTTENEASEATALLNEGNEGVDAIEMDEEGTNEAAATDSPYFSAGDQVNISAATYSDAFLAGSSVVVGAEVGGDLFAAANDVTVLSPVSDSLRIAANTITIDTHVHGNALLFANTVRLTSDTVIHGTTTIFATNVIVDGVLMGKTDINAQQVMLNGTLKGASNIHTEQFTVAENAIVQADTTVVAEKKPQIDSNATGRKYIVYTLSAKSDDADDRTERVEHRLDSFVVSYFVFALLGALIIIIWPNWAQRVSHLMRNQPKRTWVHGLLFFFVVPSVSILLIFTLIGIPLSLLMMILYMLLLGIARIFVGIVIGNVLVHEKKFKNHRVREVIAFGVGYFILTGLMHLPFIGWLACMLAAIWGVGGIIASIQKKK